MKRMVLPISYKIVVNAMSQLIWLRANNTNYMSSGEIDCFVPSNDRPQSQWIDVYLPNI